MSGWLAISETWRNHAETEDGDVPVREAEGEELAMPWDRLKAELGL